MHRTSKLLGCSILDEAMHKAVLIEGPSKIMKFEFNDNVASDSNKKNSNNRYMNGLQLKNDTISHLHMTSCDYVLCRWRARKWFST